MTDEALQRFFRLLRLRLGLRLSPQDEKAARAALAARIQRRGLSAPEPYLELLEANGVESDREWRALAESVTNGESYFFRDRGQFALLRSRVIPELLRLRDARRTLRVWSAGCSTGEEPYSLAVLLREIVPPAQGWNISILGTDVNEASLSRARIGVYGPWSFRGLTPGTLPWLRAVDGGWEVDEAIRRMVRFRVGNLVTDDYTQLVGEPEGMDLIVCRNVFIYFEAGVVASIAARMTGVLAGEGFLMSGHAELHGHLLPGLRACSYPEGPVYRKTSKRLSEVAAPGVLPAPRSRPALAPPKQAAPRALPVRPTRHAIPPPASSLPVDEWEAALQEARRCADVGAHGDAERWCRRALELEPFRPHPFALLGRLAEDQGRWNDALEAWKRVLYLDPTSIAAHVELAAVYAALGDGERARRNREAALALVRPRPASDAVEHLPGTTAGELVRSLEQLLGAPR